MIQSVPAGDLMAKKVGSVNPAKHKNEVFELFSIPAYDSGQPDIVSGSEIGSSKKNVEPGDVLISRIVPHIRRCWVVPVRSDRRQIASGEWITFRSKRFFPNYLRHYLMSDGFHKQFMQTVSGVGGSLLRARPTEVEKILIPLPPLSEQKRIASILDKADSIRRKRKQAIQLSDTFLRSVFLDMFGNRRIEKRLQIGRLATVKGGKRLPRGESYSPTPTSHPYIRIVDFKRMSVDDSGLKYLRDATHRKISRYTITDRDVYISIAGTIGLVGTVPSSLSGANLTENAAKIIPDDSIIEPQFLAWYLNLPEGQTQIEAKKMATSQPKLALFRIEEIEVPTPPLKQQYAFLSIAERTKRAQEAQLAHLEQAETAFLSLSQRAFRGDL